MKKIIFFVLSATLLLSCTKNLPFDSEVWKNASEISSSISINTRKLMIKDLLKKKLLTGKNKEEIFSLLGESESYDDIPDNELYYTIDIKYEHFGVDPIFIKYFIIVLDKNRKYKNFKYLEIK